MPKNPDPLKIKRPGHGGKREGAGRPSGADAPVTKRSKKVANEIAEGKRLIEEHDGTDLPPEATPLDVMLMAMRKAYKTGGSLAAFPYAEKCAPYLHARIANIELSTGKKGPMVLEFRWANEPKPIPEA
jgi:hypothetical protein